MGLKRQKCPHCHVHALRCYAELDKLRAVNMNVG